MTPLPLHGLPAADASGFASGKKSSRVVAAALLSLLLLTTIPGCSLFVMAGKVFYGDPKIPSKFKQMTQVELSKGEDRIDLADGITRRMKIRHIDVVEPDLVAGWLDDHGSFDDPSELARDFTDVDYIAWIEVQQFSCKEVNSPTLLRGRSTGSTRVYKVEEIGGERIARQLFEGEFTSVHPEHQPISTEGRSATVFQKEYIDRVCDKLAMTFYDVHTSEVK
jgi:hypothetical protein